MKHASVQTIRLGIDGIQDGVVLLDGPGGVAVTMTPEAAELTADSLHAAASQARQSNGGELL